MKNMEIKLNTPLTINEIDFRVQSINKGGYATILAYKDARVDMNRLDAVYGVDGWQKKYDLIDGKLFCSVGVYSEKLKQWIWKAQKKLCFPFTELAKRWQTALFFSDFNLCVAFLLMFG